MISEQEGKLVKFWDQESRQTDTDTLIHYTIAKESVKSCNLVTGNSFFA